MAAVEFIQDLSMVEYKRDYLERLFRNRQPT